jgi:Phosphotransferase enzyme family
MGDGAPPLRRARLVLVSPDGVLIGSLPPFPVELPWWQEVESVVRGAQVHHAIDVTILRLLDTERERPHGGEVSYLAEVARPVPAQAWQGRLASHPLRHTYATPGGPAADLAWVRSVLDRCGLVQAGAPEQVRSWNLSSVWRIPLVDQTAWLKAVPPFFAHEGEVIEALADWPVPRLLGHEGGRMLLAEIPGEDMYEAELPELLAMVTLLVRIQAAWFGRADQLLRMELPDWREAGLTAAIADVVRRTSGELASADRAVLDRFVSELPARFAALQACGLPDTLAHGDFHPGNFRGTEGQLTLLDWGDSCIGHPMLDQPAFLDRVPPEHRDMIAAYWCSEWSSAVPGSDPARAATLLAPIAAARQAVVYRRFLDNIEPSEQVYHRHDPADWLSRTAVLLRKEAG